MKNMKKEYSAAQLIGDLLITIACIVILVWVVTDLLPVGISYLKLLMK